MSILCDIWTRKREQFLHSRGGEFQNLRHILQKCSTKPPKKLNNVLEGKAVHFVITLICRGLNVHFVAKILKRWGE